MSKDIRIKKGLDIKLKGKATENVVTVPSSGIFSIRPTDFHGVVPKLTVKVGDKVMAGDTLFYSKQNEAIKFSSPVSGEVLEITRGEKRKVLSIEIQASKDQSSKDFGKTLPTKTTREEVLEKLLSSGCWAFINQRPYDTLANPSDTPKAIFVSSFDTNPLAIDYGYALKERKEDFQTGIDVLNKLTKTVHLSLDANTSSFFDSIDNVELHKVTGIHPAGNVGIQISEIDPINQGEKVWTVNPQDVVTIGALFNTGNYNATRTVALVGSGVLSPSYIKVTSGQSIGSIVSGKLTDVENRIIEGSVLNGRVLLNDSYIGQQTNTISVIPEGREHRFMGWMPFVANGIHSASRTSFSWLFSKKEYEPNTNMNGEERAMVVTGDMEKVMPLDIYPMQLLKAILAGDIEKMENLGIYEVAPEDFSLIDYTSSSKVEAQDIIRQGLDIMIKEVG